MNINFSKNLYRIGKSRNELYLCTNGDCQKYIRRYQLKYSYLEHLTHLISNGELIVPCCPNCGQNTLKLSTDYKWTHTSNDFPRQKLLNAFLQNKASKVKLNKKFKKIQTLLEKRNEIISFQNYYDLHKPIGLPQNNELTNIEMHISTSMRELELTIDDEEQHKYIHAIQEQLLTLKEK